MGTTHQAVGGSDLVSVIVADHREIEAIFAELERDATDPRRRRDLTDQVIMDLVRHAVAEEQYLYPAVREMLPDGDRLADHEIAEHSAAEETMNALDGKEPGDPEFEQLLTRLMSQIRQHVQEEEGGLLPRLAAACTPEKLEDLGRKLTNAKKMAPTRPHPMAPDTPPANKLMGPATGLVDRLRDAITGRGTQG